MGELEAQGTCGKALSIQVLERAAGAQGGRESGSSAGPQSAARGPRLESPAKRSKRIRMASRLRHRQHCAECVGREDSLDAVGLSSRSKPRHVAEFPEPSPGALSLKSTLN